MTVFIQSTLTVQAESFPVACATIVVKSDRVAVSMPEIADLDHEYVEKKLLAVLRGIREARWLYRRTYGKRAP